MAQKWEVTLRLTSDPSNNPDQNVFPASDEKGGFAIFEKHMNLGNIVVIQDVKVSDSVREIVMHYPNETKCNEITTSSHNPLCQSPQTSNQEFLLPLLVSKP